MKKAKHHIISYIILILIILFIAVSSYFSPSIKAYFTPTNLRQLLLNLGVWGYFAFIGLILISVPTPLPSTPIILAGGYVYGPTIGITLALIAGAIGGSISFYLARYYGLPLINKIVDKHHIIHFNHVFKKRGESAALISFALPLFPNDVLTFLLGLTSISFLRFMLILTLGHIPRYFIVTILGNDLFTGITIRTILVLLLAGIFILISIFREKIKLLVFKELKKFEKGVKKTEKNMY